MDRPIVDRPGSDGQPALDRLAERRDDRRWIEARMTDSATRYVPLWRSRCLLRQSDDGWRAVLLKPERCADLPRVSPRTFLGTDGQRCYFAVSVNDIGRDRLLERYDLADFLDLRLRTAAMPQPEAEVLAYAKALHYWQHRHAYCGVCGQRHKVRSAGHRMVCTNPDCGRQTFPRIDPAIIVLVTHGESCLLGRQASWPNRRYSTLAGFVEPGESLEAAVAREVDEESGVQIHNIRYFGSQPWPFPASTMVGFTAEAESPDLNLGDELEDALWRDPDTLLSDLQAGNITLSPPSSIAYHLVDDWFHRHTGQRLAEALDHRDTGSARLFVLPDTDSGG